VGGDLGRLENEDGGVNVGSLLDAASIQVLRPAAT
jgi:hypothetical protein